MRMKGETELGKEMREGTLRRMRKRKKRKTEKKGGRKKKE